MDAGPGNETRPSVHVIDSADSSDAADEIIRGLDKLGVDASAPLPTDPKEVRAIVVLLSTGGLHDPVWIKRVESLRAARLVPVRVGQLVDSDVPDYLRELNWVFYKPDDPQFMAQLFTGINTDASRFRDARDTRALAERWAAEDFSPDFLLENVGEVRRRIRSAVTAADGGDPLVSPKELVPLIGSSRDRRRLFVESQLGKDETSPWLLELLPRVPWIFQDTIDQTFIDDATTIPVAFLAASRLRARKLRRQRIRQVSIRAAIAIVAIVAVVVSAGFVTQQIRKEDNAIGFSVAGAADISRPDLTAIKAGASLVDSGTYAGDDGRLHVAVDALSQHWPIGYISPANNSLQSAAFLNDGSVVGEDGNGALLKWSSSLSSQPSTRTGAAGSALIDVDPVGGTTAIARPASLTLVPKSGPPRTVTGLTGVGGVSLAPKDNLALVRSGSKIWTVKGIEATAGAPVLLGAWDDVLTSTQTVDGRAVALVENAGRLLLVRDDGSTKDVGTAPVEITDAALAPNGSSFTLASAGYLWASTAGGVASTGIPIPGVVVAMSESADGLVLISDRTRGGWVADPRLGIDLGGICTGFPTIQSFSIDPHGNRVVCVAAGILVLDSLDSLRPKATGAAVPTPVTRIASTGQIRSLSLSDGFIRIRRSDGTTFAFDSAGLSMPHNFQKPSSIATDQYFGTGSLIGADGLPSTVAMTADGGTFAIGFTDGQLLEIDVNRTGGFGTVGSWQLPDNAAVQSISWSDDNKVISATTAAGTTWTRASCSGCWRNNTLTTHIAARAWLCYAAGDIDSLGDTARTAFRLRACTATGGR